MDGEAKILETKMERAAIPRTSLQVSRVALGTWAIGGWMWGGTDEAESIKTIRSAIEHAAQKRKIVLPAGMVIDAEVDLNETGGAYYIAARLFVSLPGVERSVAQALVDEAHHQCPYSKATRGNIDVQVKLI